MNSTIPEEICNKMESEMNGKPTDFELNPNNLLWQNDSVFFIDWELSRFSIPSIEFGGMLYCNGKNKEVFNNILEFFGNDEKELVLAGFYLKLLDSLCWRIKYLKQIKLNKEEHEYHLKEFYHDLDKIDYPK